MYLSNKHILCNDVGVWECVFAYYNCGRIVAVDFNFDDEIWHLFQHDIELVIVIFSGVMH